MRSVVVLWCCTVWSSAEIEGRPRLAEYLPENNQPLVLLNTSTTTCHSELMVTALQPPSASQRILRSLPEMLQAAAAAATEENEINSFLSVDTETLTEESMQFQLTTDGSGDSMFSFSGDR